MILPKPTIISNKLTLNDFNHVIKEDINLYNFIKTEIVDNSLMSIIYEIENKSIFDFIFEKELITHYKKFLNKNEMFFSKKNEKMLKNIDNMCVTVNKNDCCDVNIYFNKYAIKTKITNLTIVPTYINFDEFSNKIEKQCGIKDWNKKFEIFNIIKNFYKINNIKTDSIQIGGFILHPIQYGYENFIAFFHGGYGDDGALYLYFNKIDEIVANVDMH